MALRPRFTTPFSRFRDLVAQWVVRPFKRFEPRTRLLMGFGFLVALTAALLVSNHSSGSAEDYREGEIVRGSIVARADTSGFDVVETERRRNAARLATRPIFNFDSTRGESSGRSFRAAWVDLKDQFEARTPGKTLTWSGEGGAGG